MKGILYGNFLLNRKWFIWAGIAVVFVTAGCAILYLALDEKNLENIQIVGSFMMLVEFLAPALCAEWLGRNLENNIKCRFTDITLAGGITRSTFALSELLNSVISVSIGIVMAIAARGVMSLLDSSFWSRTHLFLILGLGAFIGAFEFAMQPLVIKLRSSEKAGIICWVALGFGVVMPLVLVLNFKYDTGDEMIRALNKFISQKWLFPAAIGLCALIYIVFYFVLLKRLKRGDVC